jgi:hypothetical protein
MIKNKVYISGDTFRKHFYKNPDAFFNDNLGEVLVLIDINRKVGFFTSWYRYTENHINNILDNSKGGWFCSVCFFIWAIIVLLFYKLWFITFPLIFMLYSSDIEKIFSKMKIASWQKHK